MERPNRLLRIGLLIAAIVLADSVLIFSSPLRDPSALERGFLFVWFCLALTTSQIAALSIWVAVGSPKSPRRVSVALLVDTLLTFLFLSAIDAERRAALYFSLVFLMVAMAIVVLFSCGRAWRLRIVRREAAGDVADQIAAAQMQFSLLSLMVVMAILGSLAALVKFLFSALDVEPSFRDVVTTLIICPSFTILAVLAAWLAWGNRLAVLRWSLVIAGFAVSVWGAASTDVRFVAEYIMPLSLYLCLLWIYLWVFRCCGYEAVWLVRRPATAG